MTPTATRSAVSLAEAAEDRRLFGLSLSEPQRELLRLLSDSYLVVCAAGRQSGKSLLAAVLLVHNLLLRPDLDARSNGSPRYALAIANSQAQAAITLAYARQFVERSPLLRSRLESARDDRLQFTGGRVLVALPCSDRLQRGLSASAVVCDEFGHFIHETAGPRIAERVWTAVRPAIAVYGEHAQTLLVSTPGDSPLFAKLWAKAANGELGERAAAFQRSTAEMNPRVSAEFLEAERALLGADYPREYLAQFVSGATSFLDVDELRDVVGRYSELPPTDLVDAVVGFDPAFSSDPSAAVVVGRSRQDRTRLLVARVERWAPKRSRTARRRAKSEAERKEVENVVLNGVAALAKEYRASVVSDQHLARVVADGLRQRGVERVVTQAWTGTLLTEAFRAVRARVIADTVSLPRDETLVSELTKIRSRARAGASSVEIPRTATSHMDSALALASAIYYLDHKGTPGRSRTWSSFRVAGDRDTILDRRQRAHGHARKPEREWLVNDRIARVNGHHDAAHEALAHEFAERGITPARNRT
jgi:hypothetical protein